MSTAFQLNYSPAHSAATVAVPPITAPKPQKASSDITELVLTKHSPDAKQLLLPMLAHLSQDSERWITWICDHKVDRNKLADYGVDTDKIRIIYSNQPEDTHWILWEALNAGTSHTVIAAPGDLNDEAMRHFENAAQLGNSRGLFIRYR
ncbi:MAG: hypothetical protein CL693_19200 [Cellvibrionaceae bacterium]|nr:hypothetical protein [Cellvibrionaceae bacterium]|tara:strand:+ start:80991 stop:81437 length:447 start_codon:yes stop_codon:yes gene_type:complete